MTENDYIAEYVKEKHSSLLGFDFQLWRLARITVSAVRTFLDSVDYEALKKAAEENGYGQ